MPSVSNYDTPCGPGQMNFPGMRTDYNLLGNSMIPEANQNKESFHAEPLSSSGSNNTVNFVHNFHGSSNGYYGYHMITSVDSNSFEANSKDECFMDTTDDLDDQGYTTTSHMRTDRLIDDARRKRPLATPNETLPKRSRQECISDGFRQAGLPPPLTPHETRNIRRFDELRRSAVFRSSNKNKSEEITLSREPSIEIKPGAVLDMKKEFTSDFQKNLELLETLLKETHGCDLYNYRICDL